MSCASSWRVAPCGNGASVVLPASGVVCSAPALSVAASLVVSSGGRGIPPLAQRFGAAAVAGAVFVAPPAGSTAITRLGAPEAVTFGCGAAGFGRLGLLGELLLQKLQAAPAATSTALLGRPGAARFPGAVRRSRHRWRRISPRPAESGLEEELTCELGAFNRLLLVACFLQHVVAHLDHHVADALAFRRRCDGAGLR